MILLRIIDKETGLFLRDDFTFDEETEIGLVVEPSQGLNAPKWDGEKWIATFDEQGEFVSWELTKGEYEAKELQDDKE